MSCYVIVENGKVTGRRSDPYKGHIEAPDWVECGDDFDGTTWTMDEVRRKLLVNSKAGNLIIEKYPMWEQLNMERTLRRLNDKLLVLPLSEESKLRTEYEAAFVWIDSVVAESDRLSKDVDSIPNWPK